MANSSDQNELTDPSHKQVKAWWW